MKLRARHVISSASALLLASVAAAQTVADPMDLVEIRDLSERVGEGFGFVADPGTDAGRLEASLVDEAGELRYLAEARMNAFEESFSTRIEQGYVSGYLYDGDASGVPFDEMQPVGIVSGYWSLNSDGSGQFEALMIGRNEATGLAEAFGYMQGEFQVDGGDSGGGTFEASAEPLGSASGSGQDTSDGPLVYPPPPSGDGAVSSYQEASASELEDWSDEPIVDPGPLANPGPTVLIRQDEGRLEADGLTGLQESDASQSLGGSEQVSDAPPESGIGDSSGSLNPVGSSTYAGTVQLGGDPIQDHPYGDDQVFNEGPAREVSAGSSHEEAGSPEAAPGDLSGSLEDRSEAPSAIGMVSISWGLVS